MLRQSMRTSILLKVDSLEIAQRLPCRPVAQGEEEAMERRVGQKVRRFVMAAILTLAVGLAAHTAPVHAGGGGVGGPPPDGMVAPTATPTN